MAKKVEPKSALPAATATAEPPAPAKPKAASKPKATPTAASAPATQPLMAVTDEMIAERAYHKWKNGEPGDHHHHWVTSERELRGNG